MCDGLGTSRKPPRRRSLFGSRFAQSAPSARGGPVGGDRGGPLLGRVDLGGGICQGDGVDSTQRLGFGLGLGDRVGTGVVGNEAGQLWHCG